MRCVRLASVLEGRLAGFVEWPLFLIFGLIVVGVSLIGRLNDLMKVFFDLIFSI